MFCKYCGRKLKEQDLTCPFCGNRREPMQASIGLEKLLGTNKSTEANQNTEPETAENRTLALHNSEERNPEIRNPENRSQENRSAEIRKQTREMNRQQSAPSVRRRMQKKIDAQGLLLRILSGLVLVLIVILVLVSCGLNKKIHRLEAERSTETPVTEAVEKLSEKSPGEEKEQAETEAAGNAETQAGTEAKSSVRAQTGAEATGNAETQANTESKSSAKAQTGAEAMGNAETQASTEAKSNAGTQVGVVPTDAVPTDAMKTDVAKVAE